MSTQIQIVNTKYTTLPYSGKRGGGCLRGLSYYFPYSKRYSSNNRYKIKYQNHFWCNNVKTHYFVQTGLVIIYKTCLNRLILPLLVYLLYFRIVFWLIYVQYTSPAYSTCQRHTRIISPVLPRHPRCLVLFAWLFSPGDWWMLVDVRRLVHHKVGDEQQIFYGPTTKVQIPPPTPILR